MKFAINSLKELIRKHRNDLDRSIEFFNSEEFGAKSFEGASDFAIKNAKELYLGVFYELDEAIKILEEASKEPTEKERIIRDIDEHEDRTGRKASLIIMKEEFFEIVTNQRWRVDMRVTFSSIPLSVNNDINKDYIIIDYKEMSR